MNKTTTQSEILLQRCVDGELNEAQQRELIQELDSATSQEGWRELAIQFMEQQVLNDFFSNKQNYQSSKKLPTASNSSTVKPRRDKSFLKVIRLTGAIAAGLLLGLNLNLFNPRSSIQQSSNTIAEKADAIKPQTLTTDNDQPILAANSIEDESSQGTGPTFDIYEYPVDEMYYQDAFLPEDLRQHLAKAGWVIERQSRAYHIPTHDGNEIIVPSDTIRVRQALR